MFSARLPQEKLKKEPSDEMFRHVSLRKQLQALTHRGAIAHESGSCFVMKRTPAAHLNTTRLQSLVNQIACARAVNYEKINSFTRYVTNWWVSSLWWRHEEARSVESSTAACEKKDASLRLRDVMTRSRLERLPKKLNSTAFNATGLVTRQNPTYVALTQPSGQ